MLLVAKSKSKSNSPAWSNQLNIEEIKDGKEKNSKLISMKPN